MAPSRGGVIPFGYTYLGGFHMTLLLTGDNYKFTPDVAVANNEFTPVVEYQWTFGSEGSSTAEEPTFAFSTPGFPVVTCYAQDLSNNMAATAIKDTMVLNPGFNDFAMPFEIVYPQFCDAGDYLLLAGGLAHNEFDYWGFLKKTWKFKNGTWTQRGDLVVDRASKLDTRTRPMFKASNGKIYCHGQKRGSVVIESYDDSTGQWSDVVHMPYGICELYTAQYIQSDEEIMIYGGQANTGPYGGNAGFFFVDVARDQMSSRVITTAQWAAPPFSELVANSGSYWAEPYSAVGQDGKVYIVIKDGTNGNNRVLGVYDPHTTGRWFPLKSLLGLVPVDNTDNGSCAISGNHIYIFGLGDDSEPAQKSACRILLEPPYTVEGLPECDNIITRSTATALPNGKIYLTAAGYNGVMEYNPTENSYTYFPKTSGHTLYFDQPRAAVFSHRGALVIISRTNLSGASNKFTIFCPPDGFVP